MKPTRRIEKLQAARVSACGEGMTYEVVDGSEKGKTEEASIYPIFTIIEDDGGTKLIELYREEEIIRIPLDDFELNLKRGREVTHNEAYYD